MVHRVGRRGSHLTEEQKATIRAAVKKYQQEHPTPPMSEAMKQKRREAAIAWWAGRKHEHGESIKIAINSLADDVDTTRQEVHDPNGKKILPIPALPYPSDTYWELAVTRTKLYDMHQE